jgi:predicted MPP superfamily phosphohydrolase
MTHRRTPGIAGRTEYAPLMSRPSKAMSIGILASTLIGAMALVVALNESSSLDITQVKLPGAQIRGVRIAVISDLHLSSLEPLHRTVQTELAGLKPDFLVIAGDAIEDTRALPALSLFLSRLPKLRTVATLGNWEHWGAVDLAALRATYERHGVELLVNRCIEFDAGGQPIAFLGLDDHTAGAPDLDRATRHCRHHLPTVIVQHSPEYFDQAPEKALPKVIVGLAGHTHGGQIKLFGQVLWTPSGSGRFVEGLYETRLGKLFVTRGVGTSRVPIRLGSRPEIGVVDFFY